MATIDTAMERATEVTLSQVTEAEKVMAAMGVGRDYERYYEVMAGVLQAFATNYHAERTRLIK